MEFKSIAGLLCQGILYYLLFLLLLLAAASLTGRTQRAYPTIAPDYTLEIAGDRIDVHDLAIAYQPIMHLRPEILSPPLLWVWYEAVSAGDNLDLVYYHVWENEIHPNPIIHKAYALFRAAYYGYPIRDIEYLQMSVRRSDGMVSGLMFETSPQEDYNVMISEHLIARYNLRPDGLYDQRITKQNGEFVSETPGLELLFDGQHVKALAQTWNHLTRLLTLEDSSAYPLSTDLRNLTAGEYSRDKFVRKSQGDHRTPENPVSRVMGLLAMFFNLLIPGMLVVLLSRAHKKPQPSSNAKHDG
ncbi:MAG: hypothetical protein JXB15_07540 [Anaerolineales bacterium]|nr:hypothetical protein [Anaerolineales bacterium]